MQINVLDLGSNSFHLLQAWVSQSQRIETLGDRKHLVRLGDKAFQKGEIDSADWQRGMHAVADLLTTARAGRPAMMVAVATSVFRDTRNGKDFLADVRHKLGLEVELLSEGSEAELSLRGALQHLSARDHADGEQTMVVDIGGGSLELALGDRTRCVARRSFPLGVLRLSHACLGPDGIMRPAHVTQVEELVRTALAAAPPILSPGKVVLASGTARRVAKLACAELVAPGVFKLSRKAISKLIAELVDKTASQLIARGVPSARTDTLGVGAVALATVLDALHCETAFVTTTGLREGVAARALDEGVSPARGGVSFRAQPRSLGI